ncbi:MAG: aryl-sulfate sulfotransferase [Lachnospiraceae bacterium]
MKKLNIILLLVAMISLVGLGAVLVLTGNGGEEADSELKQYQDGYVENTGRNKDIIVKVAEEIVTEPDNIYDLGFQSEVRAELDELIAKNIYDEDRPLVAYNPFRTNGQSLYVYFETVEPYAISYSVHVPDSSIPDFGGNVVPVSTETSQVHEFQITGLLPGEVNMITLRMLDADGVMTIRRFYYQNNHEAAATELFLKTETGTKQVVNEEDGTVSTVPASKETLSDGLFVAFPKKNELKPYLRMYDNHGVQRAEIPLRTYGTKRLLLNGDRMYYRISETEIVCVNRLGQVEQIFTAKGYTFGEDYILDKNQDLLVIASDKNQTSVNDCVILINHQTGEVTELFDLGDLLPDYKKRCAEKNGVLDWIGLNSIDWEEGNQILLTSGKTGVIIKVRRLYNEPRIAYLIGDKTEFEDTPYEELFLRVDNEFDMHDGVNIACMMEYDKIRESRQYIYLLNNNKDAEYGKKEEPVSYYYRYLVDEAEFGVRLMDSIVLSGVAEDGSVQWYQEHLVANGDLKAEFYEYDSEFNLITKFTYREPKVEYTEEELEYIEDHPLPDGTVLFLRVMKYDFYDYFFMKQPTIVVPAARKEESESKE